jgi:acyl-CoA synthetase (AMP-forming)/AMP-acid ligase II
MIHRSPLPGVEIPDVPLTSYILAGAAAQEDKPALIDGASGQALTYGGLDSAVRSLAGGLLASGFARGDVLAVMAPNVPEYAVVFHGAAMAGGVVTTINPTYTENELNIQLRDSGARILVTTPPLAAAAARGCAGTQVAEIYVLGEAAPLKVDLADECAKRLDCEVVQGYGMTELSPASHMTPPGWFRPGSVGVTAPNTQTRIVDPLSGADVGVGEEGEIWVSGPQVMKGYLNNPEATAAMIDSDGWLRTGDLGHIDADGHLYVVDRLKELIKYKGFQVPPAELEAVLLRHPDVTDAAVVGLPDEEAGEIPVGYVTLRPGASTSPEQIRQFVAGQVAGYKQLRRLEVIDAIPKSASGKILRRVLRDAATQSP